MGPWNFFPLISNPLQVSTIHMIGGYHHVLVPLLGAVNPLVPTLAQVIGPNLV